MPDALFPQGTPALGTTRRVHLHEQAARQQAGRLRPAYESHEFDVPAMMAVPLSIKTIVDHTMDCSCGRSAFALLERGQRIQFRNRGTIPVVYRLNSATLGDPITVADFENHDQNAIEFDDIFLFNDHASLAVAVKLVIV